MTDVILSAEDYAALLEVLRAALVAETRRADDAEQRIADLEAALTNVSEWSSQVGVREYVRAVLAAAPNPKEGE